jgi:hypothetical protein
VIVRAIRVRASQLWAGRGSEAESAPGVVEAVGVGEANVGASSAVLGVTGLHPEDVLGQGRWPQWPGTLASVAMVRPPIRQLTPKKEDVSTLIMVRAAITMEEMRAGVGTGSG